jgi:SSS family solute:Na+ symporter
VPYYWRAGVYTLPEFLGRRYNAPTRWIHALVLLIFMLANLSIMLWTSAVFLNNVLGWNYQLAIWSTALVVGIYTVSGGLAAVVMTDVMQLVVMFVGTAALVTLALWELGGPAGMVDRILAQPNMTEDYFHLLVEHQPGTAYPWTGMVFSLGIIMSTAYFVGNQAVMQRALGARSEWDAKAGMLTAGIFKMMIPVLVFLPGMAARAIVPDLGPNEASVPVLINMLLPAGLKGLMFAAFFAALMSSVDSYLNSCVTIFTEDVYRPAHMYVTGRVMSDRYGLVLGRGLTATIIIGAAWYAPSFRHSTTLYDVIQTLLSLFQGPTLAILLAGIFWRRATGWGGLAGLTVGFCLTFGLNLLGDAVFMSEAAYLFVSFWSFWISLAVTIIVSLLTREEPIEKLRGLVYGLVVTEDRRA